MLRVPTEHLKHAATDVVTSLAPQAFQSDPPTRIFLLGARAAAVGLTLTSANHVYLLEPLMSPAMELQAIGRSHRLGQTRPVTITRFYIKVGRCGAPCWC